MSDPGWGGRLARTLVRLAVAVAVAGLSLAALAWVKHAAEAMPGPGAAWVYLGVIGLALVAYSVLLALPFVPGVEVGIMILAMQGPAAALPVYLATLAGLMLSYWAGRHLPAGWIAAALGDAGLRRAAEFVARTERLSPEQRLELLRARLPAWMGARAVGWRYLLLALLLNLPGNGLVGGGGGIMLVAGLSQLFRPLQTLLAVALGVAPVPVLVWAFGIEIL